MLLQINIILLTILCMFYGFGFEKRNDDEPVYKETIFIETNDTIIVCILLIIVSCFLQLFSCSLSKTNEIFLEVLTCIFCAIEFKIFVLFFYIVRRISILKGKK